MLGYMREAATHPQGSVVPVAETQHLNADHAGNAEHGEPPIDDLPLCKSLQAAGGLTKAEGVLYMGHIK